MRWYLPGRQNQMTEKSVHEMLVLCVFQLLGELLLDRHNFQTMTRYISSPENLKLMMIMLREKSRNIQFEAFHVFKVSRAARAAQGF